MIGPATIANILTACIVAAVAWRALGPARDDGDGFDNPDRADW